METVNLLDFLNKTRDIYSVSYATKDSRLPNLLDLMVEDEQFTRTINLGLLFVNQKTLDQYLIIDGLNRIIALHMILHAVCECYKKTSAQNDRAIKTIREKYLFKGNKIRLHLQPQEQDIYNKIIMGEKLSSKEKSDPMFILLHDMWLKIKEEKIHAEHIFKMLNKIVVELVECDSVSQRDLYYNINKEKKELNNFMLVADYLKEKRLRNEWDAICSIFEDNEDDLNLFFGDYFITKFSFKEYNPNRFYEIFTNYFETMLAYKSGKAVVTGIKRSASLYKDLLYAHFSDVDIKNALIQIKLNGGDDTYAYLLNIYEDYTDNNISKEMFLEILSAINEYLRNRKNNPDNISFNELINYLNTFIICK